MPYTQHLHARKVREQTYVDVAYLLKNGVKPRKVRKSLGISGRQLRKALRYITLTPVARPSAAYSIVSTASDLTIS